MNRPRRLLIGLSAALAVLAGCGGGGDEGGSGGGGGGGGPSAASVAVNTARIANINTYRDQCGGTSLAHASSHDALIIAAVKHAGYQAIYDGVHGGRSIRHTEPESNALFINTDFYFRIQSANGGTDIPNWTNMYEGVSSRAGQPAIDSLWNTVYHRLPMMRHHVSKIGYGDQAMARTDYPAANVPATDPWGNTPAGNGYATLDYLALSGAPSITASFWPKNLTTGVPASFSSNSESPDPVPGVDVVGPPIHAIFPTATNFSTITVTLIKVSDGSHVNLRVLVGGTTDPTASGDTTNADTVTDASLDPGELFMIPLTALAAGSSYTYTISALADAPFNVTAQTFTTAP